MKLPNKNFKVKIGPYTYEVIYSKDVGEQSGSYGSINYNELKIFIDDSKPLQMQEATLLHEVMHGLFNTTGINDRIAEKVEHPAHEEEIVCNLSTAWYQFINDNQFLFK